MPGQEVLFRGKDVILYRSIRSDGVVELEKFVGLSPWDCKRSVIVRASETEGRVEVRFVEWTCNAGSDGFVVDAPDLARDFATMIRNMKVGYEGTLDGFEWMLDTAESIAKNRDKEINELMSELIDMMETLESKDRVIDFLRRAKTDEKTRQELLQLIEDYVNDP